MRMTEDDLLAEALTAQAKGALLVDIRGDEQPRAGRPGAAFHDGRSEHTLR